METPGSTTVTMSPTTSLASHSLHDLSVEIKKVQVLKEEAKKQRDEIVVYKKAMNMMAMEMKSMQKGKISNILDGKYKAVEDKLKIVEKENEDLVVRLKIKTTEKENAENSVSHVMSVLDTMTRANEH